MSRGSWRLVGVLIAAGMAGRLCAQSPLGKPAAVVNGEVIPAAELAKLLEKETPSPHPLAASQKEEMRKMALDMLIDDALMRQYLARAHLPVNPADIAKEMQDLQQALSKQNKSFKDFLAETGQTEAQLRADIVARLQWKAYVLAQVPDQALRSYYDQNKLFFDKIFVRASHILLRVPAKASEGEKAAVRAKLAGLRKEIVEGKVDFAQAARLWSDCPSKVNGGDIGHFPYKFAVQEPFARAAFALGVGDISDVVETELGYDLIKVTERTRGEPSNFETMKDWVRDVYAQEHELYQRIITEQRKTARIEVPPS